MQTTKLDEFVITGIAIRTSNLNGQAKLATGSLWNDFFVNNIPDKIPETLSPDIYTVYTAYEDDSESHYTAILGCRVKPGSRVPSDLVQVIVPASFYEIYTTIGKLPEAIISTWSSILESGTNRRYTADFDLYDSRASNPFNAEVITYVSVLPSSIRMPESRQKEIPDLINSIQVKVD